MHVAPPGFGLAHLRKLLSYYGEVKALEIAKNGELERNVFLGNVCCSKIILDKVYISYQDHCAAVGECRR